MDRIPGGGRDFSHTFRPALGPTQPPIQWELGHFHGGLRGRGLTLTTTPSSGEVKERVELYVSSSSPPLAFVVCARVNFYLCILMLDGNYKCLHSRQNCFLCGTLNSVSEQCEVLYTHPSSRKQFHIALSCFMQYRWPHGFTVVHRLP